MQASAKNTGRVFRLLLIRASSQPTDAPQCEGKEKLPSVPCIFSWSARLAWDSYTAMTGSCFRWRWDEKSQFQIHASDNPC